MEWWAGNYCCMRTQWLRGAIRRVVLRPPASQTPPSSAGWVGFSVSTVITRPRSWHLLGLQSWDGSWCRAVECYCQEKDVVLGFFCVNGESDRGPGFQKSKLCLSSGKKEKERWFCFPLCCVWKHSGAGSCRGITAAWCDAASSGEWGWQRTVVASIAPATEPWDERATTGSLPRVTPNSC